MRTDISILVVLITCYSIILLTILFSTAYVAKKKKQLKPEMRPWGDDVMTVTTAPLPKAKTRNDEVLDTLNWMLSNAILSTDDYNKLIIKCMPYLK